MQDKNPITLKERITVRKYDGDPPQPGEDKPPVEVVVIEDGQVISRMNKENESTTSKEKI